MPCFYPFMSQDAKKDLTVKMDAIMHNLCKSLKVRNKFAFSKYFSSFHISKLEIISPFLLMVFYVYGW